MTRSSLFMLLLCARWVFVFSLGSVCVLRACVVSLSSVGCVLGAVALVGGEICKSKKRKKEEKKKKIVGSGKIDKARSCILCAHAYEVRYRLRMLLTCVVLTSDFFFSKHSKEKTPTKVAIAHVSGEVGMPVPQRADSFSTPEMSTKEDTTTPWIVMRDFKFHFPTNKQDMKLLKIKVKALMPLPATDFLVDLKLEFGNKHLVGKVRTKDIRPTGAQPVQPKDLVLDFDWISNSTSFFDFADLDNEVWFLLLFFVS